MKKVSVYFKTKTITVYHSEVSDESYESLIDKIVSKLVIFSSHRSDWQLLSINKVTLKLARFVSVRGSSYIPVHEGHPLRCDPNLLNINNGSDDNCFPSFYTGGYDLAYEKEKLEPPASCFRPLTNVLTYSRENTSAKMPKGNLKLSMSLHDISKCKYLNEVQINMFR